ncbi:MAG TPA: hypothetical protein VGC97_25010 [Pyrinomonadaceae bacterium]|jgi:hypothetical protein
MAWHLTVSNNFYVAIMAIGHPINANENRPHKFSENLGNGFISVPGIGNVNFLDIGKKDVGGHSNKTWGVLISYQGEELIFRYENDGDVKVTINEFGQAEFSGNGDFSKIKLSSFILK